MLRCTLWLACVLASGCYLSRQRGDTLDGDGSVFARDLGGRTDGSPLGRDAGPSGGTDGDVFVDGGPFGGFDAEPLRDGGPFAFEGGPGRDTGPVIGFDTGPRPDLGPAPDLGRPPDLGPPRDLGLPRDLGPPDLGAPDLGPPVAALRISRNTYFAARMTDGFSVTRAATQEIWLRARSDGFIMARGDVATGRYSFGFEVRSGRIFARWSSTRGNIEASSPITFGRWTHVAATLASDGTTTRMTLYVDGLPQTSAMAAFGLDATTSNQPFFCGNGADADVTEIRLFQSERSAAVIRALHDRRISPGAQDMIAYWQLTERGQLVRDFTLRGHDGVLGDVADVDPADAVWISDGPPLQ